MTFTHLMRLCFAQVNEPFVLSGAGHNGFTFHDQCEQQNGVEAGTMSNRAILQN